MPGAQKDILSSETNVREIARQGILEKLPDEGEKEICETVTIKQALRAQGGVHTAREY